MILFWIAVIFIALILTISIAIGIAESRGIKGVCIQCGFLKRDLLNKCPRCKFKPSSDEELAKVFLLSTREHHVGNIFPGKPLSELKRISKRIENGKVYEFKQSELEEVRRNF